MNIGTHHRDDLGLGEDVGDGVPATWLRAIRSMKTVLPSKVHGHHHLARIVRVHVNHHLASENGGERL